MKPTYLFILTGIFPLCVHFPVSLHPDAGKYLYPQLLMINVSLTTIAFGLNKEFYFDNGEEDGRPGENENRPRQGFPPPDSKHHQV